MSIAVQAKVWARATIRDPRQHFRRRRRHECPCCGYEGYFATANRRLPKPFRCPNCESRPRDRQIWLWLQRQGVDFRGKSVLHFAPEWPLFRKLRREPGYVGGDIRKRRNANAVVDITDIGFPENHFDFLICNHVLEHVPADKKAMAECFRVLKAGGLAVFSVPLLENAKTWEPPEGMPVEEIERICGWDHKRYYGQDFDERLSEAGFSVKRFCCNDEEKDKFCLFEDTIFISKKPEYS